MRSSRLLKTVRTSFCCPQRPSAAFTTITSPPCCSEVPAPAGGNVTGRSGHDISCLTTGAIEQGLIFPNNDRPGVMLAGAVRHYLNRYAICPGENIVVATNNDTAYQTVFDLAENNIAVAAVVDCREETDPALAGRLAELGTELIAGARISDTRGNSGLSSIRVETLDGKVVARRKCDLLAVSGGWAPRVHLLAHARGSLRFDAVSQSFIPDRLPEGLSAAGSANGTCSLDETLAEATRAAVSICESLGAAIGLPAVPTVTSRHRGITPGLPCPAQYFQAPAVDRPGPRCHFRRRRTCRPGGLCAGGALQALHHHRHVG